MFGGGNTFGTTSTGFGAAPAFGAAPNTSVFGGTGTTFGATQNKPPAFGGSTFGNTTGGGGLFGANTSTTGGGGLFGSNTMSTSTFGATNTAFGQPSTSFGGFGQTMNTQATSGGLFGTTTTSQAGGGLFGSTNTNMAFGGQAAGQNTTTGASFGGFGAAGQQTGTGHAKFNPVNGTDTMMKSGMQTNINTRHQCIVCMKEYEQKSMEELRIEDYTAGRRGGAAAAATGGGLFGSTQPAAGGGLFGTQPAASTGGAMFGQQQNKPLFGTSTGFGATSSAAPAFGSTATSTTFGGGGGLFGAPKTFGAATTSAGTGFGGFGQTQTAATGGLFGQQQQNKPFGAAAPQPQAGGGLFGSTNTGTTNTAFGGFGQPAQQQTVGLFGANQNQAKPAFGGFGAQPASSAPAFGGFGTTTNTQTGGLFGQTQQAKPAFGGFGTATTQAGATGFGGFGATSQPAAGGGLFGATNQAKPAFSFGQTAGATTGFTGFGGTSTGTGLFNNTAAKPGGLFGTTGTSFGTGTGFGGTTGFGTSTGTSAFGTGGLNFGQTGFGGTAGAAGQPGAATGAAPSSAVQQQLILALASSPFGENPLFKTVSDTGKRTEVLKNESSSTVSPGGKGLALSQYKVAAHRNIKVRTKPVDSVNKSSMFEGLEDDLPGETDMFVPRSSVKRLVLRNKKNEIGGNSALSTTSGDDPGQETSLTVPLDESRLIVKKVAVPPQHNDKRVDHDADESFAALNAGKKIEGTDESNEDKNVNDTSICVNISNTESDKDEEGNKHAGGIILQRNGYYTIPPLQEIVPDSDGKCLVEGFTVGREGYGNIHYPGITDITDLNLDEIVFIRHKEVIVYPEDDNKPPLGQRLNKKAQITLDKVWPKDKNDSSLIKSPERIKSMNFEDKLIRASTRIGAEFIEYRHETGSWVFKVKHFSKYGLDDSDDEAEPPLDNVKKMKTLQLEKRTTTLLDSGAGNLESTGNLESGATIIQSRLQPLDNQKTIEMTESDGASGGEDKENNGDVEMNDINTAMKQQTTLLRSALFCEDEGEISDFGAAKPVILQHRNTSHANDTTYMDHVVSSTRVGAPKGLGGNSTLDTSVLNTTSLLRSHYSIQQHSVQQDDNDSSNTQGRRTIDNRSKLPTYNLTSAYDKFTHLQNSVIQDTPETVTPQYVDTEIPLQSSFLRKRFQQYADSGLFNNKRFRAGFGNSGGWTHLETPGGGYLNLVKLENSNLEEWELDSLENWLQVALNNSSLEVDDEDGPHFSPIESVEALQNHYLEAASQLQDCADEERKEKLWQVKHTWNLLLALYDTLETQGDTGVESHEDTIARRQLFSAWLQDAVQGSAQRALRTARENNNHLAKVHAILDSGDVESACDTLQGGGDHRAALLLAQAGSGPNSTTSRLVQHQLNRWKDTHADKYIENDRLKLYSLVAGQPVQTGGRELVNTVSGVDWQRSLAHHLWYLCSGVSSVGDAVHRYDEAWTSAQPYTARPQPSYNEDMEGSLEDGSGGPLDLKYHLIKIYTDRSHSLEATLTPSSHTDDPLDFRMSWFIYRILSSLGYRMSSSAGHDKLCKEFASQLETLGLWHWAVFVLLHMKDKVSRQRCVEAVLERSVALEADNMEAREAWILDTLAVPEAWLAKAKAVLARVEDNQEELAKQLLKAHDWKEAHKVIVEELAPAAILSQDHQLLQHLLQQLAHNQSIIEQIPGWDSQGKIYLDFLSVGSAVDRVLEQNREQSPHTLRYEFERLKPLVTSLCRQIGNVPVHTSKQRLAQSEIAKQAAHYMRAVYSFEALADSLSAGGTGTGSTARQLAESLSNLALPEDYALQELRNLTRSYLSEIMES